MRSDGARPRPALPIVRQSERTLRSGIFLSVMPQEGRELLMEYFGEHYPVRVAGGGNERSTTRATSVRSPESVKVILQQLVIARSPGRLPEALANSARPNTGVPAKKAEDEGWGKIWGRPGVCSIRSKWEEYYHFVPNRTKLIPTGAPPPYTPLLFPKVIAPPHDLEQCRHSPRISLRRSPSLQ